MDVTDMAIHRVHTGEAQVTLASSCLDLGFHPSARDLVDSDWSSEATRGTAAIRGLCGVYLTVIYFLVLSLHISTRTRRAARHLIGISTNVSNAIFPPLMPPLEQ